MPLPFYLSQPVDEVLKVAEATKRKRRKVEFTGREGTITIDYSIKGSVKDIVIGQSFDVVSKAADIMIDLAQDATVRYFYDDVTLTFQRTCDDDGGGALCYRVTGIEETDV